MTHQNLNGCQLVPYPAQWTRDDWLAWRREGVGGSDVAAVAGLSPWATPLSVWLDKTGRGVETAETEPMRWGNLLEGIVTDEFEIETGLYVHHRQTLAIDVEHPWRRCTLDGLAADRPPTASSSTGLYEGVVQVKTTRHGAWETLPDQYALQVTWEMGVTGLERAWVPTLHHGNAFRIYEVDFDAATFDLLAAMVDRFWRDHVETDVAPAPDGEAATTSALRDAFTPGTAGELEADRDLAELLLELQDRRDNVKRAQAAVDLVENAVRLALGTADADALTVDGVPVVTWKTQTRRGGIDAKALEADLPEVAEKYRKNDSTSRVLRLTKHYGSWTESTTQGRNN